MKRFFSMFIITLAVFLPCATGCSSGAGGNAALDTNTIAQEYVDESDIEPFVPELPVSEQPEQKEQTEQPVPKQPEQTEQLVPEQPEQKEQTAPEQTELELPEPEPPVPEQIEHKEQTEQPVPEQPKQIEQTAPEQTELEPPVPEQIEHKEQTEQPVPEQPKQIEQTAPEQTELEPPEPEPPVPEQGEDFVVSTEPKIVAAEYEFSKVNETECRVRLANKDVATKAVIPSYAVIDGKRYTVTEIADNGFASSPNLIQVILPITAKKIGSNAFAGCAKLNRINLANVEEIGNSVFMRCPELSELIIPLSVKKIGVQILRRNNTRVKVRAQSDGEEWDEDWNKNNSGSVEYGGKYYQPIELDEVYDFDEL